MCLTVPVCWLEVSLAFLIASSPKGCAAPSCTCPILPLQLGVFFSMLHGNDWLVLCVILCTWFGQAWLPVHVHVDTRRAWVCSQAALLSLCCRVVAGSIGWVDPGSNQTCSGDDLACWPRAQVNLLHTVANASGCSVLLVGDFHYSVSAHRTLHGHWALAVPASKIECSAQAGYGQLQQLPSECCRRCSKV